MVGFGSTTLAGFGGLTAPPAFTEALWFERDVILQRYRPAPGRLASIRSS